MFGLRGCTSQSSLDLVLQLGGKLSAGVIAVSNIGSDSGATIDSDVDVAVGRDRPIGVVTNGRRRRHTKRAVKQRGATERRGVADPVNLVTKRRELGLSGLTGRLVVGAGVGRLNRQVTHTVQHRVNLVQATFSGLHHRNTVLSVASRLTQTRRLRTQLLANHQTRRIISRTVDPQTTRQLLNGLTHRHRTRTQIALRVVRHDVVVNTHNPRVLRDNEGNTPGPCWPGLSVELPTRVGIGVCGGFDKSTRPGDDRRHHARRHEALRSGDQRHRSRRHD